MVLRGTVSGEKLLNSAGREVHTYFSEHGVHNATCALKLSAARCIIAKSGSPDTLFILLIALLASFLVLSNQAQKVLSHGVHVGLRQNFGQIRVELALRIRKVFFGSKSDDRPAVLGVLNVRNLFGKFEHLAEVFVSLAKLGLFVRFFVEVEVFRRHTDFLLGARSQSASAATA